MEPTKYNLLDVSTCHITKETADWLETTKILSVAIRTEGFFVFAGHTDPEVPNDLKHIFEFANSHRCEYVVLDRDGATYETLPKFDW